MFDTEDQKFVWLLSRQSLCVVSGIVVLQNSPRARKCSANGSPVNRVAMNHSANEKTTESSKICPICAEYIIDATDTH